MKSISLKVSIEEYLNLGLELLPGQTIFTRLPNTVCSIPATIKTINADNSLVLNLEPSECGYGDIDPENYETPMTYNAEFNTISINIVSSEIARSAINKAWDEAITTVEQKEDRSKAKIKFMSNYI